MTKIKDVKSGADSGKQKTRPLTDKQVAFVREYMLDRNATQAAIRAGYSAKTASAMATALMKKTEVANEIRRREAALEIQSGITVESMLRMLVEDYQFGRERVERVRGDGDGASFETEARDPVFAMAAAEKIMKAIGGYEKDRRQQADMKMRIVWGDGDESDDSV